MQLSSRDSTHVELTQELMCKGGTNGLQETDMEAEFLSLGMDIIGLGVFNYDFRSLTTESPVIKVSGIACTV